MSLHIPNHHQTLYFTLTIPVKWLEFSQAPQVGARTLEGRSLPIDVQYVGQRKQGNIFSMSLHIPNHHQTLYSTLTIPVQWLEFSQVPRVGARTLEGWSIPIDVCYPGQRKPGNIFSMILHISNHHQTLCSTLTMPVQWLEFSQVPQVGARTLEGRSLPIDIHETKQGKKVRIFSMSI